MKVLYLVTGIRSPKASGSEFIQNLIYETSKKGVNATIISPIYIHTEKNTDSWRANKEKKYNVRFILINTPTFIKKRFILHIILTPIITTTIVINTLLRERFDIIHEFTSTPIIAFRSLIYKIFNTPSIFTLSVLNKTILGKTFWFRIFSFGTYYLIPSHEIIAEMVQLGVKKQKIFYLPPGINLARFKTKLSKPLAKRKLGFPKDKVVMTYFGQLSEEKGVFDIIRAFNILPKNFQNKIFIALYCSYLKGFTRHEKEAKKLRNNKNLSINLYEKHVSISLLLAASDCVIYPQRTGHGTTIPPISVLETLAANRPIITTNIIGIRELITKNNGVLIPPANPQVLASAIIDISSRRIRTHRRTKLDSFNLEKVSNRLLSIYNQISK